MRILYRAVCSCAASLHRGFDEKRVFFEAEHNDDAGACLVALLADIWGVPESTVIYHNLLSEYECHRKLDEQAGTPASHSPETGTLRDDMRLFEVMWTYTMTVVKACHICRCLRCRCFLSPHVCTGVCWMRSWPVRVRWLRRW